MGVVLDRTMSATLEVSPEIESLPSEAGQHVCLSGISWDAYERLLEIFEERHVRLTYDRGELEIMVVSSRHERFKKLLARLFETLTEIMELPVISVGNTTFKHEDIERGLEPDDCWYIESCEKIREVDEIDLSRDPPPDLALEVEITCSALSRLEIYASLGVREIWRFDGERLHVHVLGRGKYREVAESPTFPGFPLGLIADALLQSKKLDQNSIVADFRKAVRKHLRNRNR